MKPAELDALKFTLDPSVNFWRDYSPEIVDDKAPLPEQLQWLNKVCRRSESPTDAHACTSQNGRGHTLVCTWYNKLTFKGYGMLWRSLRGRCSDVPSYGVNMGVRLIDF